MGPGTIVGSAAFNLMCISAVCIVAIPGVESRKIKGKISFFFLIVIINLIFIIEFIGLRVFAITAVFSIVAYLWLIFVLVGVSRNVVSFF